MPRKFPRRVWLLEKLFVWSLVLEPMMFFVVADRAATGVSGNISRLLQILVLAGLTLAAVRRLYAGRRGWPIFAAARRLYFPHAQYLAAAAAAGAFGWYLGAYEVPQVLNTESLSRFSSLLNSAYVRPAFEYLIAAYYFVYFVILPQFVLNTPRKVAYFFSVFKGMFFLSLVIGFIDFAAAAVNIELVPRQIADGRHVGVRFHGLAGEPREAFVFLVFGLALFHLRGLYRQKHVSRALVVAVIVAMAATQSASGLIGLLIAACLAGAYSLGALRPRQLALAVVLALMSVVFAYVSVTYSDRLQDYVRNAASVWDTLEEGGLEFGVFVGQMTSIFPMYDLLMKIRSGDWIPVLIGSGLGSASAVNNRYWGTNELANPASQIVRMLYEVGLIGTLLFLQSFIRPVNYLSRRLPSPTRRELRLVVIVLMGCFLAHRSATLYIYLGMLICIFRMAGQVGPLPRAAVSARSVGPAHATTAGG